MQGFNGGAASVAEMARPMPAPEITPLPVAESVVGATAATPEMPASHPEVDAGTLTVDGLIKACPHYAAMAERNPEHAKEKAAVVVERVQEREAMRQEGVSDGDIKKQQWALMRARHKEKTEAKQKAAPEVAQVEREPEPQPKASPTPTRGPETAHRPEPLPAEHILVQPAESVPEERPISVKPAAPVPREVRDVIIETSSVQEQVRPAVPVELPVKIEIAPATPTPATPHETLLQDTAYPEVPFLVPSAPEAVMPLDEVRELLGIPSITPGLANEAMAGEADIALPAVELQEVYVPLDFAPLAPAPEFKLATEFVEDAAPLPALASEETLEQTTWADVLEKQPLEIYEDFTEALHAAVAAPQEEVFIVEEAPHTASPVVLVESIQELEPPPAVAAVVAERLTELDAEEKEAVAPLLEEVIEKVQLFKEISTLVVGEPEVVETVQAELEELVAALFEELGIAYEPEDIERFVAMLAHPNFRPQQPEEQEITDLEHSGTHEVKLHFTQLISDTSDESEDAPGRLLGSLVLFSAARNAVPEYGLAA
jgi:hypothetical protein